MLPAFISGESFDSLLCHFWSIGLSVLNYAHGATGGRWRGDQSEALPCVCLLLWGDLDENAWTFPLLCWPFLSVFPLTWFSVPRSPSPSGLRHSADCFPDGLGCSRTHSYSRILPTWVDLGDTSCKRRLSKCSIGLITVIRNVFETQKCADVVFIYDQWCYIENHVKSMHTDSSPGPIITNFYTTEGWVCLFFKTIWLIL